MKGVIDLNLKPDWFDVQDPEERRYWCTGVPRSYRTGKSGPNVSLFLDSERNAWRLRERNLASGFKPTHSAPYSVTRDQATAFAISDGNTHVEVINESGEVVEESRA